MIPEESVLPSVARDWRGWSAAERRLAVLRHSSGGLERLHKWLILARLLCHLALLFHAVMKDSGMLRSMCDTVALIYSQDVLP